MEREGGDGRKAQPTKIRWLSVTENCNFITCGWVFVDLIQSGWMDGLSSNRACLFVDCDLFTSVLWCVHFAVCCSSLLLLLLMMLLSPLPLLFVSPFFLCRQSCFHILSECFYSRFWRWMHIWKPNKRKEKSKRQRHGQTKRNESNVAYEKLKMK